MGDHLQDAAAEPSAALSAIACGAVVPKLLPPRRLGAAGLWEAFLVLKLCLRVIYGVAGLHSQGDGLARRGLHKYVHCGRKRAAVLKLSRASHRASQVYTPANMHRKDKALEPKSLRGVSSSR